MDWIEIAHGTSSRLKLSALFLIRIVFAPSYFHCPLHLRLKANLLGGFTGDQWLLYKLDQKRRKEYLSEFDWYRSRIINEPYQFMLNNKVVATEVLKHHVRVPEIYYFCSKGRIVSENGNRTTAQDIIRELQYFGSLIIKPIDRGKGVGVGRLAYSDGQYYWNGCQTGPSSLIRLLRCRKNWYLSETIRQHEYARKLFDGSLNTLRILAARDPDSNQFRILFAVQRIGNARTIPVDNASSGGFVCRVELETGRLSAARTLRDRKTYTVHPDSGAVFEQTVIPNWQALKEKVIQLSEEFPYLSMVAWDIAITDEGQCCVIEANSSSGVNIFQLWGGQREGPLGQFYRYHGVIK